MFLIRVCIAVLFNFIFVQAMQLPESLENVGNEQTYIFPDIVAYVDDLVITKEELQSFVSLTQQFDIDSVVNENVARQIVLEYATYLQLDSAAKKIDLDKQDVFSKRIKFINMLMLVDEYYLFLVKDDPTLLRKIEEYYDSTQKRFTRWEYDLSQIAFSSEEDAQVMIDNILMGNTVFNTLLPSDSSAIPSNHIGWINIEDRPIFAEVEGLDVGDILSKPIRSEDGYHIIYVQDKKQNTYLKFEELDKDQRWNHIQEYYVNVFLLEVGKKMNLILEPSL